MSSEHTPSARSARVLPAQPNLEHLKNEAKQRLKALRAQALHAQLTEAQLAVARDYGFASWRALKAHVDEVTRKRIFAAARAGARTGGACARIASGARGPAPAVRLPRENAEG